MPHVGDYELLASGGEDNGNSSTMRIYLYPNGSDEVDICRGLIKDSQVDMASQLVNTNAMSYYRIYLSSDRPQLGAVNRDDYYSNFKSWLNNNGYIINDGSHIGVKNSFGGGAAYYPDEEPSSFTDGHPAVVGTAETTNRIQQTSIQEALHNFTRIDLIQDMITSYWNAHETGKIYSNDLVSPMAAGYTGGPDSASTNGECSSSDWYDSGPSTTLTRCTKTGIERTVNNEF